MGQTTRSAKQSVPINGEALRTFRIIRGLSREALAEKAAPVSYSHIANLETETKEPSPELLHRIALALDVNVLALTRDRNVFAETA